MTAETPEPLRIEPLLLDAKQSYTTCGISATLWYELDAKGAIPQCIRLNSKRLWSYDHLKLWALNSCPHRDSAEWIAILKRLRGANTCG